MHIIYFQWTSAFVGKVATLQWSHTYHWSQHTRSWCFLIIMPDSIFKTFSRVAWLVDSRPCSTAGCWAESMSEGDILKEMFSMVKPRLKPNSEEVLLFWIFSNSEASFTCPEFTAICAGFRPSESRFCKVSGLHCERMMPHSKDPSRAAQA